MIIQKFFLKYQIILYKYNEMSWFENKYIIIKFEYETYCGNNIKTGNCKCIQYKRQWKSKPIIIIHHDIKYNYHDQHL